MKELLKLSQYVCLGLTLLMVNACQEDNEADQPNVNNDPSLTDNLQVEAEFDEVLNLNNLTLEMNANTLGKTALDKTDEEGTSIWTCAVVTISRLEDSTKRVVIDFGVEGCEGPDGRVRKGKIISEFNKRYTRPGSVVTTTFDGYSVNGILVEGTKTVENITAAGGNPTHTIEVKDAQLTFPNGTTTQWESTRTRTWVTGYESIQALFDLTDDVYNLSGTYEGINRAGVSYRIESNVPLEYKAECYLSGFSRPSSGVVQVNSSNFPTYQVDFGDGTCDDEVVFSFVN